MIDESIAKPIAMMLYFALRFGEFPVILEYRYEVKTIDITLPGRLYIEVDGPYQQEADQAWTDLFRTMYSIKENIPTIRIPNSLNLDEYRFKKAIARIIEMCMDLKRRLNNSCHV